MGDNCHNCETKQEIYHTYLILLSKIIILLKEIYHLNTWNRLKSIQRKKYRDIFAIERVDDFTVYISWLHFNGSRKYIRPSENQATNKGTLYPVCILHPVCSLQFAFYTKSTFYTQSAVCLLHFILTVKIMLSCSDIVASKGKGVAR